MPKQTDVTVIGLGNMGSALASALLQHGHSVTVWNRSADKAVDLVGAGAKLAESPAAAVIASSLILVCVVDYPASRTIFSSPEATAALRGRTLVQLSTGNSEEAREQESWAQAHGAQYLDGGIMSYPSDVGRLDTVILYSGARSVFQSHAWALSSLAGAQRHVGTDPGAANTIYLALWSFYFGAHGAFMEGAALAASTGLAVTEFASLAAPMLGKLEATNRRAAKRLAERNFVADEVSVDLMLASADSLSRAFASARVSSDIVNAYFAYLQRAQSMGGGGRDLAYVFHALALGAGGKSAAVAPRRVAESG